MYRAYLAVRNLDFSPRVGTPRDNTFVKVNNAGSKLDGLCLLVLVSLIMSHQAEKVMPVLAAAQQLPSPGYTYTCRIGKANELPAQPPTPQYA